MTLCTRNIGHVSWTSHLKGILIDRVALYFNHLYYYSDNHGTNFVDLYIYIHHFIKYMVTSCTICHPIIPETLSSYFVQ